VAPARGDRRVAVGPLLECRRPAARWPGPGGAAQGPLAEWADAKLGDRSAAWAVQQSLVADGPERLPNRFIDRSVREWEGQVERVANRVIEGAI
jgi:hypothetical protein